MVDVWHDRHRLADPYRWLEDGDSAETTEWVQVHNERARKALDAVASRARWHERLVALMGVSIEWPVSRRGDRLFLQRRVAGQDQPVLYVTSAQDPTAPRRKLIDTAELAADGAVALDWLVASPDGSRLAYGISEGGDENSMLHVLDVDSGELLADRIPNTRAASLSWLPDSSGFMYTRYPEGEQYNRHVYLHTLGTMSADDPVVFDRLPVPDAWPSVEVHPDGTHALVSVTIGWSRTDVHLYDCETKSWTVVIDGIEGNTNLSFQGDQLIGVTDIGSPHAAELWRLRCRHRPSGRR